MQMNRVTYLLLFLLLSCLAPLLAGELRLPAVFSDHMVLQTGKPVPVWGWSKPNTRVSVQFGSQTKSALSDDIGRWSLHLDPLATEPSPQTLTISAGTANISVNDVLVGEVWLCSGQSNMAMTVDGKTAWLHVGGIDDAKAVVKNSADPLLRQFLVEWKTHTRPQDDCAGKWSAAGPDTTAEFSATGYFFARELRERLGVPVAIVNASFGGSSVEGWTSREALSKHADPAWAATMERLIDDYENHEQLVTEHVQKLAAWEASAQRQDPNGDRDDAGWVGLPENAPAWRRASLPATLAKLDCPHGGVVWLRREVDIPEEFGQAWRLDYPACKAFSTIYLNGTRIFDADPSNNLAQRPNRPSIGKGVAKPGKNTLLIKLHGYHGACGITGGNFAIVPFNPRFDSLPLAGEWDVGIETAFSALPPEVSAPPAYPTKGTLHWMPVPSQFNAMLHPVIPFAIRGFAWYQGESNVGKPHYTKHLQILINDWRARWNQGDLPFYLNLLPGFGPRKVAPTESLWAECRASQIAALLLPNTGIANLIDTCEDGDLHPLNKQDAGRRLARVALANTYGVAGLPWSGPVAAGVRPAAGGRVTVDFLHAETGLAARSLPPTVRPNLRKPELAPVPLVPPMPESEVQGFALSRRISAPDGTTTLEWHNANARIEGSSVVVWSDQVPEPSGVRYAWADHPVCNLVNRAGLPAFPFKRELDSADRPR
jgi:sialate O-acetylesterase